MTRQCCVCKRVYVGDRWVSAPWDLYGEADITHGYCERCYEELMRSIGKGGALDGRSARVRELAHAR